MLVQGGGGERALQFSPPLAALTTDEVRSTPRNRCPKVWEAAAAAAGPRQQKHRSVGRVLTMQHSD